MGKILVMRLYEECNTYTSSGVIPEYLLKEEDHKVEKPKPIPGRQSCTSETL